MESEKKITIKNAIPAKIKKAVLDKKEWFTKIQTGEIQIPKSESLKRFA